MPPSRRTRRRLERQRAHRPARGRPLGVWGRLGLAVGGIAAVVIGVLLLAAGNRVTAHRLGRIAGILIILGLAAVAVAAIGRV